MKAGLDYNGMLQLAVLRIQEMQGAAMGMHYIASASNSTLTMCMPWHGISQVAEQMSNIYSQASFLTDKR